MAVALNAIKDAPTVAESLTIVETVESDGKRLAVAEIGSARTLTLMRETLKPIKDADGKRSRKDADGKDRKREPVWVATAKLADIATAIASGLLE